MKKRIMIIFSLAAIVLFNACSSSKQTAEKNNKDITVAIDSNRWSFVPTRMMPLGYPSSNVFGGYSVDYNKKNLNIYLPYYGRAFSGADVLSGTGPLNFISKDFTTDKAQKKPGKWEIIIKPNDNKEIRSMNFTLYSNGSATLNVTLQNRTPVSFTGTVEALKSKE